MRVKRVMNTSRKLSVTMILALCVAMNVVGISVGPASSQTTEPTDIRVEYSFDDVSSAFLGTDVFSKSSSALMGSIQANGVEFSKPGFGSFKMIVSLPFLTDRLGNPIDARDVTLSNAPILKTVVLNGTTIEYRMYYYSVDMLAYTTMSLPELPSTMMRVPGFQSSDDAFPENGITVDNSQNSMLVLEEVAPVGSIDNYNQWAYPGCAKAGMYYANTPGFEATQGWDKNVLQITQAMTYETPSLDVTHAFKTIGGNDSMTVIPKIGLTVNPRITNTVNVNGTDVEIYSAITSVQAVKLRYGIVANDFTGASYQFSQTISSTQITNPTSSRDGTTPQSKQDTLGSNGATTITGTVTVGGDVNADPSSYTEGVQQGAPLAMYIPQTNTNAPNVTTSLELIKTAPKEIYIKPQINLQPYYDVTKKNVEARGTWMQYTDPWEAWWWLIGCWSNGLVYDEAADQPSPGPRVWTIQPTTKVELLNTFVINRFRMNVIVSTVVNTPPLFASGDELKDPRYAGNNKQDGINPANVTSTLTTPDEVIPHDNLAWLNSWFSSPTGIITTIIVIVVIVGVLFVVMKIIRGRFGGGGGGVFGGGGGGGKTEVTVNIGDETPIKKR